MIEDLICGGAGGLLMMLFARLARKKEPPAPKEKQCASVRISGVSSDGIVCDAGERCVAVADPRCLGGNCTLHCRHGGCAGKCLE